MLLTNVIARKIFNSRKEVTISVIVESENKRVEASAPGGKSKGRYEVKDFSARGIDFSVSFINSLGKKLVNDKISFEKFEDLEKIETLVKQYDQTKNLEFIGGNALYAIETAVLKMMAISRGREMWSFLLESKKPVIPRPVGNCIGGGMHVNQGKKTDFQEFLLLPKTEHFFDAFFMNSQAYKDAKKLLDEKDLFWQGHLTDENAMASTLSNEEILLMLSQIRENVKKKFEVILDMGVDIAASTFYDGLNYRYKNFSRTIKEKKLTPEEQNSYIVDLARENNLAYIEDPLQDEDFSGFANITRRLKNALVVGDDLTCTRFDRVQKAIRDKAINALIIKPNQVGSLIETKKVIDLAKKNEIVTIISHRSGETQDNALAHFAIGWRIPFIKTGIIGPERLAKLNEILRIERDVRQEI